MRLTSAFTRTDMIARRGQYDGSTSSTFADGWASMSTNWSTRKRRISARTGRLRWDDGYDRAHERKARHPQPDHQTADSGRLRPPPSARHRPLPGTSPLAWKTRGARGLARFQRSLAQIEGLRLRHFRPISEDPALPSSATEAPTTSGASAFSGCRSANAKATNPNTGAGISVVPLLVLRRLW